MEMQLGILGLETRNIFDFTPDEVIDVFAFRKFAMKKLEEQGYAVLPADDFENVMMRYFCTGRTVFDRYIRTKLGKKPRITEQERGYAKKLMGFMEIADISKLMNICRLSSYIGGPGTPDYIGNKGGRTEFFYVGSEFFSHQQLFMFLASLLGFDVQILPVDAMKFSVNTAELLNFVLGQEKSQRQQGIIETSLAALREEMRTRQVADAISCLEEEKSVLPFGMLKKWLAQGKADSDDLRLLFERIEYIVEKRDREFSACIKELRQDTVFRDFGPARDEATMMKKAAYIEKKFGICDVKSKDLLNFV